MATCDPDFPLREWDRLLQQAELTLNLLRNSRINPALSAWAYLFGNFDFNKSPLIPPGTKVILHSKPAQRKSWAFHGEQGWYIGPALQHYRCLRIYIPKTHAERITDTVQIIPKIIPIPNATLESHLTRTADDLLHLLQDKKDVVSPIQSDNVQGALIKIAQLLHRDSTPEFTPLPVPIVTSEGASSATSEGEKEIPRVKTSINPSIPSHTPLHPALYSNNKPSTPTQNISTPIKIGFKSKPSKQQPRSFNFEALLKKYANIPQATFPVNKKIHLSLPLPKHKSYLSSPTPKRQHERQIPAPHPMVLRKKLRFSDPTRPNSFKHRAATHLLLQYVSQTTDMFRQNGKKKSIDNLLNDDISTWGLALSNELGRLSQGNGPVVGNNAIVFVKKSDIPCGKKVTYANMVCDYRPLKKEKFRVRLTLGGDVLEYDGNASSPAASLLEAKLMFNSVISDADKGARFMAADLKDFFLQSFLEEPEYIRIHGKYFLQDIRVKYNIDTIIAPDGYVYCKVIRGMYGLKQAAKLARDQLIKTLAPFGYHPTQHSPNIWQHTTKRTKFCLCVDDFGIKYYSKEDAEHLLQALRTAYEITVDTEGKNFCGMTLDWNYQQSYVDISMPEYVQKALDKLQHTPSTTPQHAPHRWVPITYGNKIQNAPVEDSSPCLSELETRHIQRIVGSFLYYARAIDNTIHPALNCLGSNQAKPTEATRNDANMLMDYLHTHPNAKLRYHKSGMQLHIDSDAAYLVAPKAKSRVAGYFYLSNKSNNPVINAPIHIECAFLKHVVSSAAEAETGGIFHNAKSAIHI